MYNNRLIHLPSVLKILSNQRKIKTSRDSDASIHSCSNNRESGSDMGVDQPSEDKVNYVTIEERKLEESKDLKKNFKHFWTSKLVSWSKLSLKYFPLRKGKSIE